MKAIIPAAGFGTRFLPVTKAQPKEMLPVLDRPIAQYVVEEAVAAGVEEVLLITGRGKRAIEDHFDRSRELEVALENAGNTVALRTIRQISNLAEIFYVRQKNPAGLGHAVRCGAPFIGDEPFYVMLGDVIVPEKNILEQLEAVHRITGGSVIAVEEVPLEKVSRYGVIDGEKTVGISFGEEVTGEVWDVDSLVEKPAVNEAPSNLAIFGRYLLTPRVMEILKHTAPGRGGEIQLTDALVELAKVEPMHAVVINRGAGFDTGNVLSWLEANVSLGLRDKRFSSDVHKMIKQLDAEYEERMNAEASERAAQEAAEALEDEE